MATNIRKIGLLVSGGAMLSMAFLVKPAGIMLYPVIALGFCGVIQIAAGIASLFHKSELEMRV